MKIAIPLFDGITALDAIGPYEVLSRIPGAEVSFVAAEPGQKRTDNRMLGLSADVAMADLTDPEILVFPGGYGTRALMKDAGTLDWVRTVHAGSTWTTSVCTGSLVLAAAGVLEGLEAATHWLSLDILR
jgi:putative intracellular protease/amidase